MRLAGGFLIAAALCLAASGRASADETLRIAVEDAAAPWSARDGTGYANDLVLAAFGAAGVDVELLVVPYERCKRMVTLGDVAACFSMSWEPELDPTVSFPAEPLFTCQAQFFEAVARPVGVSSHDRLPRGTAVATVLAYEYPPEFRDLVRRGVVRPEESVSEEVALQRLASGRVPLALVITDESVKSSDALLRRAGVHGLVRAVFGAGVLRTFIGFSKRHPRGPWALARFDEGFRRIRQGGQAARIQADWRARAALEAATRTGAGP